MQKESVWVGFWAEEVAEVQKDSGLDCVKRSMRDRLRDGSTV